MSPSRPDSLTPLIFKDFTGGLWERGNDREVAPNGLLECLDCMPLRAGGLRAAWAWKEENLGTVPTNRRVIGFQVDRGSASQGNTIHSGLMLGSTLSSGFQTYEYWFAAGTTGNANVTTWSSGPTHTSVERFLPTRFRQFALTTNRLWYYNVGEAASTAVSGVFRFTGVGLASSQSTRVFGGDVSFIAPHQERLVYAWAKSTITATPQAFEQLIFTNPTTDASPPTSNILSVGTYDFGNICYMEPFYPQELLVLKQGQGGYLVQGDVGAGPLVRAIFETNAPERMTWGIKTPQGVAYLTETDGVWMANSAETRNISRQFTGSPMVAVQLLPTEVSPPAVNVTYGFLGALGFAGRWLYTPKGYIYDLEMGSWFRVTMPGSGIFIFSSYDDVESRMYMAGHKEPGSDVRVISCSINESTMTRSGTFSFTLPLIDTIERNVEARILEIFGQGFGNGGTWTVTLTNNRGQTETHTESVDAQADSARFDIRLQGDWLKVRIQSEGNSDATSETGKSEAPMVDKVVVWTRPRQTRP